MMLSSHLGEIAALLTALFWTITAMAFESAGKKVGSLPVNWIRLVFGFIFISFFTLITRGQLFPMDAPAFTWKWLFISGLIGFAIGDLLLFRAFVVIGSRISMLIMSLVPPFTALIGWMVLGEVLSGSDILGMALTISGIALVVLESQPGKTKIRFSHPVIGILLALGGALGQSIGLILSKLGMRDYNAFAATQIRIIAGIFAFSILFFPLKTWPRVQSALRNVQGMKPLIIGAFFGPFLGVGFSLLAVQHTAAGVASTIMSIVPVLIIPPAIILYREKVSFREILGAFIAVSGVALLFLTK